MQGRGLVVGVHEKVHVRQDHRPPSSLIRSAARSTSISSDSWLRFSGSTPARKALRKGTTRNRLGATDRSGAMMPRRSTSLTTSLKEVFRGAERDVSFSARSSSSVNVVLILAS